MPQAGNLSGSEAVYFTNNPGSILGPWAVVQASGTSTVGDYLTTTATTLGGHTYYQLTTLGSNYDLNFSQSGNSVYENATAATTLTSNWSVYVMKTSSSTMLTGQTLTVASGGMLFNGGEISGGTIVFGAGPGQWATPLIYAGSSTAGTIASALEQLAIVQIRPWNACAGGQ